MVESNETWCSTKTDENGYFIEGQWGSCGDCSCDIAGNFNKLKMLLMKFSRFGNLKAIYIKLERAAQLFYISYYQFTRINIEVFRRLYDGLKIT